MHRWTAGCWGRRTSVREPIPTGRLTVWPQRHGGIMRPDSDSATTTLLLIYNCAGQILLPNL